MAFTSGTATNHNTLLTALRDFLVGSAGWTELYEDLQTSATAAGYLTMRAPGALAGHEYFLYIDTNWNVGAGQYSWAMRGFTGYDPDAEISQQEGISPIVWYNLWENSIDYWFYANGRRVVGVAKCNTSYMSFYAGLLLPFALPTEYPKPFYIGASYPSMAVYDIQNARNRMIADPGNGAAYYLTNTGVWRPVQNHSNSGSATSFQSNPEAFVWPHRGVYNASSGVGGWNDAMGSLRPTLTGELPMFLCHVIGNAEHNMVGAMEGVYGTPGFGRTSEQQISHGAKDFRVFQNTYRTTNRDFMAIEEA